MQKNLVILGEKIVYREFGTGSPIILFHGYGGNPNHWEAVATELSSKYRVIVPSLSSIFLHREKRYGFAEQVDIITHFIKTIVAHHGPVHVAGTSYGGTLAWAAASVTKMQILSMTLLSPMPPSPKSKIRNQLLKTMVMLAKWPMLLRLFLVTPFTKRALTRIEDMFIGRESRRRANYRLAKLDSRKLALVIHILNRFSWIVDQVDWVHWNRDMKSLSIHVCLIWGNWDRLFLKSVPWDIERNLHNCRLFTVDKAGHLAMKENAPAVLAIMNEFLSQFNKNKAA